MSLRTFVLSATTTLACVAGAGCASEGLIPTDELTKARTAEDVGQANNALPREIQHNASDTRPNQ
jgi:hypothetical protein